MHLGRSPFHPRFASCTSQSLLRSEASLDIQVQAFAAPYPAAHPTALDGPGLPFLRYEFLLRLEAQGTPSLVCPLDGTAIHRMAVLIRLAPGQSVRRRKGPLDLYLLPPHP